MPALLLVSPQLLWCLSQIFDTISTCEYDDAGAIEGISYPEGAWRQGYMSDGYDAVLVYLHGNLFDDGFMNNFEEVVEEGSVIQLLEWSYHTCTQVEDPSFSW